MQHVVVILIFKSQEIQEEETRKYGTHMSFRNVCKDLPQCAAQCFRKGRFFLKYFAMYHVKTFSKVSEEPSALFCNSTLKIKAACVSEILVSIFYSPRPSSEDTCTKNTFSTIWSREQPSLLAFTSKNDMFIMCMHVLCSVFTLLELRVTTSSCLS
jgi:hypothetical protein